ncbi:hypothetical protein [Sphingomonas sp. Leaf242]|uniref:hypothetical protein n=1 Tax=Sphingomonas sp. Leaf242 TaxID=1736304 RepID=UPI00138F3F3B|nr:hypothetical protein [Sphingomonas sp. Leaf242]
MHGLEEMSRLDPSEHFVGDPVVDHHRAKERSFGLNVAGQRDTRMRLHATYFVSLGAGEATTPDGTNNSIGSVTPRKRAARCMRSQ